MIKEYLQEKFRRIKDERHQSYVEHKISDILIIVMSSVLCGLDQLADIMVYAQNRKEFFKNNFGIEQIPSKPTFSRVLNMMNGSEVAKIIIEIMKERADIVGDIIAVDGKAIRSTSEKGKAHSALQILTAYLTESSIVIGQEAIHNKTNEIPVFQAMLDLLDITGKIITADAMHCQTKTCEKIIKSGGNYVFGLKENQKNMFDDVVLYINSGLHKENISIASTLEKSRGRIEKRICRKVEDISWLHGRDEWKGLNTVFSITRITTAKGKTTTETNYYIGSVDVTAEELLRIVREHWKIESMHWLLDVVFSEDECRLLSENGQLWGWGNNHFAQLGNELREWHRYPVQIANINNVVSVSANLHNTTAVTSNGTLWIWGRDFSAPTIGLLGGTPGSPVESSVPVQIKNNVANVSGIVVIRTDGSLWQWTHRSLEHGVSREWIRLLDSGVLAIVDNGLGNFDNLTVIRTDGRLQRVSIEREGFFSEFQGVGVETIMENVVKAVLR